MKKILDNSRHYLPTVPHRRPKVSKKPVVKTTGSPAVISVARSGDRPQRRVISVDEASAMYLTGGDQKRRLKLQGGSLTRYRWDAGFNMVHEENYWGPLERTYVHHPLNWTGVGTVLGDVAGANPATGDYRYYMHDHLGSTRMLYAQNKALLGQYRFTPYGEAYDLRGAPLGRGFTGQIWDAASGQYYFPMRHYAPAFGRWTSREPSGIDGPNMYHYGFGSPINAVDIRGEWIWIVVGGIVGGAIGGIQAGANGGSVGWGILGGAVSGAIAPGVGAIGATVGGAIGIGSIYGGVIGGFIGGSLGSISNGFISDGSFPSKGGLISSGIVGGISGGIVGAGLRPNASLTNQNLLDFLFGTNAGIYCGQPWDGLFD